MKDHTQLKNMKSLDILGHQIVARLDVTPSMVVCVRRDGAIIAFQYDPETGQDTPPQVVGWFEDLDKEFEEGLYDGWIDEQLNALRGNDKW